nr:GGDEF domain-containing protein [Armatimonas sp.]
MKELSHHLSTCLRSGDLLGRWGGEEFLLLLPNTTLQEAQNLAHRLVSTVRERRFANNLPITLSIGGAACLPGERPEDVVHRADTALYQAKQAGRDCFRFHMTPNEAKQAA